MAALGSLPTVTSTVLDLTTAWHRNWFRSMQAWTDLRTSIPLAFSEPLWFGRTVTRSADRAWTRRCQSA